MTNKDILNQFMKFYDQRSVFSRDMIITVKNLMLSAMIIDVKPNFKPGGERAACRQKVIGWQ
jgi:hypothetical protein